MRRLLCTLAFCLAFSAPALAASHGGIYARVAAATGLTIPALAHNQLAVMDAARADIVALSQQLLPHDPTAQTLRDWVAEQRAACLYGLVRADWAGAEGSPLHLCTHAFLAGTEALRQLLLLKAGENLDVQGLNTRVTTALLLADAAPLCRYSGRSFDTAEVIHPHLDLHFDGSESSTGGTAAFVILALLLYVRHRRATRKA
jgi:hypothetical protein